MALAVSSMRLAQKKVLLHDMKSIETLARVDVMCVDKTGTYRTITCEKQLVAVTADEKDNYDQEETEEKEIGEKM